MEKTQEEKLEKIYQTCMAHGDNIINGREHLLLRDAGTDVHILAKLEVACPIGAVGTMMVTDIGGLDADMDRRQDGLLVTGQRVQLLFEMKDFHLGI